jgi:polar amino acid transport system substrate-binding protein
MRNLLISSLVLAAVAALAIAATASGARGTSAAPAAIPGCAVDSLNLVEDGVLTIGADNPAFPPWFGGAEKTKPWKVSDPYSGKGYESAVAYAVAKELGFIKSAVKWTVVPFNNSFRPGKKPFDFYVTQVSYDPQRARAVDFSKSYYYVNQAVVGRKGKPIAKAKSIAALKPYKLGAQVGTTSYTYITKYLKPSSKRPFRR